MKLFLSYSMKDENQAKLLYESLTKIGHTVFKYGENQTVETIWSQIYREISSSDAFICLVSQGSLYEANGAMKEVECALYHNVKRGMQFIPVMLSPTGLRIELEHFSRIEHYKIDDYNETAIQIDSAINGGPIKVFDSKLITGQVTTHIGDASININLKSKTTLLNFKLQILFKKEFIKLQENASKKGAFDNGINYIVAEDEKFVRMQLEKMVVEKSYVGETTVNNGFMMYFTKHSIGIFENIDSQALYQVAYTYAGINEYIYLQVKADIFGNKLFSEWNENDKRLWKSLGEPKIINSGNSYDSLGSSEF